MPVYKFECGECAYVFEEFQSIANIDVPLHKPCPYCKEKGHIGRLLFAPEICEPQRVGAKKVPSGYKEVIKNMKKHYPGNTLDENVWS